jgi:hypothetical protein
MSSMSDGLAPAFVAGAVSDTMDKSKSSTTASLFPPPGLPRGGGDEKLSLLSRKSSSSFFFAAENLFFGTFLGEFPFFPLLFPAPAPAFFAEGGEDESRLFRRSSKSSSQDCETAFFIEPGPELSRTPLLPELRSSKGPSADNPPERDFEWQL